MIVNPLKEVDLSSIKDKLSKKKDKSKKDKSKDVVADSVADEELDFEPDEEEDEKSKEKRRQLEIQKEIKALKKELKGGKGQKSKGGDKAEEGEDGDTDKLTEEERANDMLRAFHEEQGRYSIDIFSSNTLGNQSAIFGTIFQLFGVFLSTSS